MESILKRFEYRKYLKPTECTNSILVVEVKNGQQIYFQTKYRDTMGEKKDIGMKSRSTR